MHNGPPAIVFGGGINGLGMLRNLAREGVRVYSVLDGPDPIIYSKYCSNYFVVPHVTEEPESVRSFLNAFAKGTKSKPVVFPTSDRTTLILGDLKDQMGEHYVFVVPEKKVAETLIDKSKFYQTLIERGIEHPRVIVPGSENDMQKVGEELGYPVFVRPCISQDFAAVFRKKGFVAHSEEQLAHYCNVAAKHNLGVVFQEVVPGSVTNVYGVAGYFDNNSEPKALFGYHRIRCWPLMFGNSTLMESVPIRDLRAIKPAMTEYLRGLKYQGIMDAEFKRDPRDGVYKLTEINARSWWQNSFPTRCGLNIVYKAYLEATGHDTPYCDSYEEGVRWVNLLDDVSSSIATHEIATAPWLRSLLGVRDFAFFSPQDPGPSAGILLSKLGTLGRQKKNPRQHD